MLPVILEPSPLEIGRKLFVGGNIAYVGGFTGYRTISVFDPVQMFTVGLDNQNTPAPIHDLWPNGSGLLVAVTSFAGPATLAVGRG